MAQNHSKYVHNMFFMIFWVNRKNSIFGPKMAENGCPRGHTLGTNWAQIGRSGPKIANFSNTTDFHGTGQIPLERGSKCATFMSTNIFDETPAFSRFFKNRDFLTLCRTQNGLLGPKIAIFSNTMDLHGTGHIPLKRGSKCATFMSPNIFHDF